MNPSAKPFQVLSEAMMDLMDEGQPCNEQLITLKIVDFKKILQEYFEIDKFLGWNGCKRGKSRQHYQDY